MLESARTTSEPTTRRSPLGGVERRLVDVEVAGSIVSDGASWADEYNPRVEHLPGILEDQRFVFKRAFDAVGAAVGLVLLAPLLAILALLIKLDSRGPVFFAQARLGLGGRVFRMYKLRTMRVGADDEKAAMAHLNQSEDSRLFKIPADPRVTRLGRTIRRWSLDELPQLYNVLVGDMSLVGPRPFFEADLSNYEARHFARLAVKPGLTGLWQVSGRSDIMDFEEVVRLDREYIDTWSMQLDLRILGRTVPAVVMRRGAY
jgi:lipopolysaccharide/colanic/teichoic acid biosynthesis glycosyltransferase